MHLQWITARAAFVLCYDFYVFRKMSARYSTADAPDLSVEARPTEVVTVNCPPNRTVTVELPVRPTGVLQRGKESVWCIESLTRHYGSDKFDQEDHWANQIQHDHPELGDVNIDDEGCFPCNEDSITVCDIENQETQPTTTKRSNVNYRKMHRPQTGRYNEQSSYRNQRRSSNPPEEVITASYADDLSTQPTTTKRSNVNYRKVHRPNPGSRFTQVSQRPSATRRYNGNIQKQQVQDYCSSPSPEATEDPIQSCAVDDQDTEPTTTQRPNVNYRMMGRFDSGYDETMMPQVHESSISPDKGRNNGRRSRNTFQRPQQFERRQLLSNWDNSVFLDTSAVQFFGPPSFSSDRLAEEQQITPVDKRVLPDWANQPHHSLFNQTNSLQTGSSRGRSHNSRQNGWGNHSHTNNTSRVIIPRQPPNFQQERQHFIRHQMSQSKDVLALTPPESPPPTNINSQINSMLEECSAYIDTQLHRKRGNRDRWT